MASQDDLVGGVFGNGGGEGAAGCVFDVFPGVLEAGVEFAPGGEGSIAGGEGDEETGGALAFPHDSAASKGISPTGFLITYSATRLSRFFVPMDATTMSSSVESMARNPCA